MESRFSDAALVDDEARTRAAQAADIADRMCVLAAHIHAAMAELASLAHQLDGLDGWCGDGIRSFAHWLTVNAGFAPHTGDELLRVGGALEALPLTRAAFAAGRLSFESVRELTTVVTSADERLWLDLAASASGAQLARICRACRRALDVDSPRRADEQVRRRGLWLHSEDDGMFSLRALLLPEEGALVRAALEAAQRSATADSPTATDDPLPQGALADTTTADDPAAFRRADALVALCESAVAQPNSLSADPTALPMVVHVDVAVLTGHDRDGRRHVEGGPTLPLATIRRLGCDASVVAITERNGVPIDVGRRRRIVPRPLRRAIQSRDRTCRYPGCGVRAQRSHIHHVTHWANLGPTERDNLLALCHFHHRRVHEDAFHVIADGAGGFRFETATGQPIPRPLPEVPRTAASSSLGNVLDPAATAGIRPDTAGRVDGCARLDLDYVVSTILDGVERARAPAAATA